MYAPPQLAAARQRPVATPAPNRPPQQQPYMGGGLENDGNPWQNRFAYGGTGGGGG
jgi:hypothetical protein